MAKTKPRKKPSVKTPDLAAKKNPKGGDLTITKTTNSSSPTIMK